MSELIQQLYDSGMSSEQVQMNIQSLRQKYNEKGMIDSEFNDRLGIHDFDSSPIQEYLVRSAKNVFGENPDAGYCLITVESVEYVNLAALSTVSTGATTAKTASGSWTSGAADTSIKLLVVGGGGGGGTGSLGGGGGAGGLVYIDGYTVTPSTT